MLKVGELAKHTGLTVRTLHHYDEIGLLRPSGRSDAGYRLYSQADVARLHGIQALRHLGLALNDIGEMLDGAGTSPALIIEQQMRALDQQIDQATELRARLGVMQAALAHGEEPGMAQWLDTLTLMTTYGKYFSAAELKIILTNWKLIESEWQPLLVAVRAAMDQGRASESVEVQPLAQRWMTLMLRWMGSDFNLIERWGDMYDREPTAHRWQGAPQRDMAAFIRRAVDQRLQLFGRYLAPTEMRGFRHVPEPEWQELSREVTSLIDRDVEARDAAVRPVVQKWLALLDRLVGQQPGVRDKLLRAHASEPLLAAGSALGIRQSAFLRSALNKGLTLTWREAG